MLFDERDLNVFNNSEAKKYFMEIVQSYYCRNYRSSIVMLYSFVIYDLYMKMKVMSNEGDSKATTKLKEIEAMIKDDEKYSMVEREIVEFFMTNCSLYFKRFNTDVVYLRDLRNNSAHLKVNDDALYEPNDYQVRMLICSMFDNIFSVNAPFIMDLFSVAQADVEYYSNNISRINSEHFESAILHDINKKYLSRMTFDSLKVSYKTFTRLLYVSNDSECIKNIKGLYVFTYALIGYLLNQGHTSILKSHDIIKNYERIDVEDLANNADRRNAIISICLNFPCVLDSIRDIETLFNKLSEFVLLKPHGLKYYKLFHPREEKTLFGFYLEKYDGSNKNVSVSDIEVLYQLLKDCEDFSIEAYLLNMIDKVPSFNGFGDADMYMAFLIHHKELLTEEIFKKIKPLFSKNRQFHGRDSYKSEIKELEDIFSEKKKRNKNSPAPLNHQ